MILSTHICHRSLKAKSINSCPVKPFKVINTKIVVAHEPSSEVGSYTNTKNKGDEK